MTVRHSIHDPTEERFSANMIFELVLLCLAICPTLGQLAPNLKVRYDFTTDAINNTAFIEMPLYECHALTKGWKRVDRSIGPIGLESLSLWCPEYDRTVCLLYDKKKYVAGLQIAVEKDAFSDVEFDWKTQGYSNWTTVINGTTIDYYTVTQYYVSKESLEQQIPRNTSLVLQNGAIWVSSFNGDLYKISTNATDFIEPDGIFTKQNCIQWMGTHYYYNMSAETECKADSFFPWFPLVYGDQLIGIGYNLFAIHVPGKGPVNWFEYSGDTAVQYTVPNGPQCLYDLSSRVGQITLHTYFIDAPYEVNCLAQIPEPENPETTIVGLPLTDLWTRGLTDA